MPASLHDARKCGGGHARLETWGLSPLDRLLYQPAPGRLVDRLARRRGPVPVSWLTVVDVAMVVPVAVLLAVESSSHPPTARPGKLAYLFSVAGLYLSFLRW